MISTLPNSSFVPVVTQKVIAPTVAWINDAFFSREEAIANAFCIRQNYEAIGIYGEERIQWADLYGGYGIGDMGGSGRCATFGNLQIKGVGRTSLIGPKADRFHTSGTMVLAEAAREVIWSQILPVVLPYGVVPSLAIVLSNGVFMEPNPQDEDCVCQRTLLMREFVLRPAHFMRNPNFRGGLSGADGMCDDARVKRDAINTLGKGFDQAFGAQTEEEPGIEKINLGLRIMASRFGAQIAACFAKRVFHGALSCSNIALDGRLLDFGVITFVECYGRRAWAKGWLDQWTQHGSLLRTLHNLRFQIQKYLNDDGAAELISEATLIEEFSTELTRSIETNLLKMTGAPGEWIENCSIELKRRLFKSMQKIYMRGANEPYTLWPADLETVGANMPPSMGGRYNLNLILATAACTLDRDLDAAMSAILDDVALRSEFIANYSGFRAAFLAQFDKEKQLAGGIYLSLQAVRLNADLSFLRREILDEQLYAYDATPEGVGKFIEEKSVKGRYFLQDAHPDLIGEAGRQQIEELLRIGAGIPDFVLSCMSAADANAACIAGIKNLLKEVGHGRQFA